MQPKANLPYAVSLCALLNSVCRKHGYFVALTGGCLYSMGERKDIDVLFYVNRNMTKQVDRPALLQEISAMLGEHVAKVDYYYRDFDGFVYKTKWNGIDVDMLFPNTPVNVIQQVKKHSIASTIVARLIGGGGH